jgi:sulfoxide reductase heme-binding subunit YedZ
MKDPRFPKLVVFVCSLVPLALMSLDGLQSRLGANPVEYFLRKTGILTIVFLTISLLVTPARLITGKNWLSHFRRMLGLTAFFYGTVHLSIYFVFDRSLKIGSVVSDTINRPFIFFGMLAFFLMIPLAITSTNGMIKRLGSAKWKRLHQAVYLCAIAGVVHYWMIQKADISYPLGFAIAIGILFAYRILVKFIPQLKYRKSPASSAA